MGRGRSGVRVRRYASGREAIQIDFTFRGVRCRETLKLEPTKQNLRYAERLRAEVLARIERGQFTYTEYFPESTRARKFGHQVSRLTVGEALSEWLADAERTKTWSTFRSYRTSARSWLIPYLGDIRLADLQPIHIRELVREHGGKVKTISNVLLPLRGVIRRALQDQVIDSSPLDKVDISELVSPEQRRSDYQVDPFTGDELLRVIDATGDLFGENGRNLVQLHAFAGPRTGELFGLSWVQVSRDQVRIDRAVVHGRDAGTKTAKGTRDIPLTPMAAEALRRQKAVTGLEGGLVFRSLRGNRPAKDYWKDYSEPFKRACQKAGVRYRQPYQLRHTFASQLLSGGENPLMVAEIMGHTDTSMIFRVYGKWIDQGRKFVSAWGSATTLKSDDFGT
jgi:integrase